MARQTGIIKLKGKIGDLSFYKTKDGHLAREKGGVDADRIKNDPAFIRTRENGAEFGSSASAGKLLRDTVRPLMLRASDGRVTSRMTKVMTQIKNLDTVSARGERSVAVAIPQANAKALLEDFNFNNRSVLGSILYKPYTVDPLTGEIVIANLIPFNDIAFPQGATHYTFTGAIADIDFGSSVKEFEVSNEVNGPLDLVPINVTLTPNNPTTLGSTFMVLMLIEFFQEVNGNQYPLNNGSYNALSVVAVP